MEKEIATELEYDELTKTGKVLVDFYADWCGPCQMLTPIIKEIADEHPELTVLRVNVDKVGGPARGSTSTPSPPYSSTRMGR